MTLEALLLFVFVSAALCDEGIWNTNIAFLTTEIDHIQSAAIAGTDGTIYGRSHSFPGTEEELKKLSDQFNDHSEMRFQGVTLGGNRYLGISSEADLFLGRNPQDNAGLVAYKTTKTVTVAIYDSRNIPNGKIVIDAVENVGQQLKNHGF